MLSLSDVASLVAVALIIAFVCKTWVQRQRMMLAMILIFGAVVFFTPVRTGRHFAQPVADRNVDLSLISSPFTIDLFGQSFFFGTRDMNWLPECRTTCAGSTWASPPPRRSRSTPASS